MIKTILFDWDGTLLNSNQLIYDSHKYVLDKYFPNKFSQEDLLSFNGPSLEQTYRKISPNNYQQLIAEYRQYNQHHHNHLVSLFPGVTEGLIALTKANIQLAIVSTKYSSAVMKGVELFQLAPFFKLILGGDQYKNAKPNPEGLIKAMDFLEAKVSETIMVGDSFQDIEAAHRAQIPGVYVSWSEKDLSMIESYQPEKIISSMDELIQWLINVNKEENCNE